MGKKAKGGGSRKIGRKKRKPSFMRWKARNPERKVPETPRASEGR